MTRDGMTCGSASRRFIRAPALALAVSVALFCLGCGPTVEPKAIDAIDASTDGRPMDFTLTDHTGKQRHLAEFRGKVVAVFFGYTQCPNVCPTTLYEFAQAYRLLGPDADTVQVLFVTVDPERDTQRLLGEYVPAFDARFIGLFGTPEETRKVADMFSVSYVKVPGQSADSYQIDHTAYVFLLDPAGRLRLKVPYGQSASALIELIHDVGS